MRAKCVIIVGISVGIVAAMSLCLYLIFPLFVPVHMPAEVLRDRDKQEKAKAEREEKERQAAYAKHQERIRILFDEKRDSSEICQVHKDNLKADRVRIAYGLILPPEEYREAQEGQFPNSNKFVHGGCILREPEFAYVLFCTRCREEETRWERQQHRGPIIEEPNKENFIPIGADEAAAHLLKKVEATYPGLAEQARITGVVKLNLYINQTGRLTFVELLKGHPLLSQAAIDATRNWRYRPFLRNGVAVRVLTEVEVPFTLDLAPGGSQAKH